jgi:DNA polymerase-1
MNLLFRSYYATAASGSIMRNSQGQATNAVYGFVSAFQQLLQMEFTDLLVAFDAKGPTHRHLKFPEYKGTRKEAPIELLDQIPLVKDYLDAAGVSRYEQETMEADDIIGHMVKFHKHAYDKIVIISNDRDLHQLLDSKVSQMISKKGFTEVEIVTPESMMTNLGIRPDQMTDYKALVGDASDNIPGVKGIGDKTAVKLLEEWGTLENLLAHVEALTGKLQEKLIAGKESAMFSKELATILTDFPNPLGESHPVKPLDYEALSGFYKKMELHGFLRKLEAAKPKVQALTEEVLVLRDDEAIKRSLSSPAAVVFEHYGFNYHVSKPLGFGIATAKMAFFVPYDAFRHSPALQAFLKDPMQDISTYDAKAFKVRLLWDGYDVNGVTYDLKLASYLVNPVSAKDDFRVASSLFECHQVDYDEDVYGKGAKASVPSEIAVARHAVNKAKAIAQSRSVAIQKLVEYGQLSLFTDVELPLTQTLANMEFAGISVDETALDQYGASLSERIAKLDQTIRELSGVEGININSPKQLGILLFETLKLPYYKKSAAGGYSTDAAILTQLVNDHPIIRPILEYRQLTKLFGTYYEGLKTALATKGDGKIHTIYQQTVAATGRLSSIEPNLQNIPIRTEEGRELRRLFVAAPSTKLLSCDYSQIELRVLAELGDCTSLKEAFANDLDIHTHTARLVFQHENITPDERRQAKAINFGIIYGKTPWGLADDLGISLKQAERFIANYFASFPEIKSFMDKQIQMAQTEGYVETAFKRRRYIPEVKDANYQVRENGKRMAMNAPIQGTAADLLKIAMVKIDQSFQTAKLKSKLLLQIHDELVVEVAAGEEEQAHRLVKDGLEHAAPFSVVLKVEGGFGNSLYEVK